MHGHNEWLSLALDDLDTAKMVSDGAMTSNKKSQHTFYFLLTALCITISLQALQVTQKETSERQHHATQLELQMIQDAMWGDLTEKTLQQYLNEGADINATNHNDETALMRASNNGHTAVVKLLIDARADIHAKDNYGFTALIKAFIYLHTAIAQQLIAAGADIDVKNNSGNTALMWAADNGQTATAQRLIAAGADINAKGNYGETALIWASFKGDTEIIQPLIAAGSDQTIANKQNKTARDYAKNKDAYDKAVAAGLQERKEYLARQSQAKQFVAEQTTHIPGLQDIIMGYAYGPSPSDLPPLKPDEEKKMSGK